VKDSVALWGSVLISAIVTFGFFLMLYMVLQREIPAGSRDLANIMLGYLGGSFTAVVGYWVGSSIGSARKDMRQGEHQSQS
jgi:glycerol uptake facilitator-like aquaporin